MKLELGGQAEILLVDPEEENDPIVGRTENPDPHFELDRLRIEPVLRFSRAISLRGQVDFKPIQGQTRLMELTARYSPELPAWWVGFETELGLDDRFIRPGRRTKNYPLLGNAFWRRESLALTVSGRLGNKDGPQAAGAPAEGGSLGDEGFSSGGPARGASEDAEAKSAPEHVPGAAAE